MHGLELEQLAVDGCSTKAPCGGQTAGPSPVDRHKQGRKRSVAAEAGGIRLAALPEGRAGWRVARGRVVSISCAPKEIRGSSALPAGSTPLLRTADRVDVDVTYPQRLGLA